MAAKIREGAAPDQVRAAVAVRFGAVALDVDLEGSPSLGPESAPVVVTVWSDFGCPHCRRALPILEGAVTRYAPYVRLVQKYYPLRSHPDAETAARAAIAANNQQKHWQMAHILFAHQGSQRESDCEGYAKELGLDVQKFRADLASEETTRILKRDRDAAERAGLSATPLVLINGRELDATYFHLDADLDEWVRVELEINGVRTSDP
jgi:predicted DsbA family dithiol-disulfide isomerase